MKRREEARSRVRAGLPVSSKHNLNTGEPAPTVFSFLCVLCAFVVLLLALGWVE